MKKNPLIGISIITVVLLILGSLSNVVGYQSIQSSNQNTIIEEVNQKDLLFQTIVDMANNKEIQRIILKSQISRGLFLNPDIRFSVFNTPVLTKNQLKHMYVVGLVISKVISKSRMQSMVQQYQLITPETQQEISAVIEKNNVLKEEISQLFNSECDCGNKRDFPTICSILAKIMLTITDLEDFIFDTPIYILMPFYFMMFPFFVVVIILYFFVFSCMGENMFI